MELWKNMGWEWSFVWCGVGTRDVPAEHVPLLVWIGHCMALLGGVLSTGDAPGSDTYFYLGYNQGKKENMPPAQIYYTRLKKQRAGLSHDPLRGEHEAERYETYEAAKAIAFKARGSFEGLFPSGVGLHTRNAFQVLSETLEDPRWITLFYATPVGKKGKVSGGTNTAVQISIMHGIKKVNLYVEEERTKFVEWLKGQLTKRGISIPDMPTPSTSEASS
jgi:hypothetical protein